MAKSRRLTMREKKLNAELKKKWQEEGIIPPDKPKLDRKRFIQEAMDGWNSREPDAIWDIYIYRAIGIMMGHSERRSLRRSLEAVGAAKILKTAMRLREFHEKNRAEGKTEYRMMDEYDYIKDILDA